MLLFCTVDSGGRAPTSDVLAGARSGTAAAAPVATDAEPARAPAAPPDPVIRSDIARGVIAAARAADTTARTAATHAAGTIARTAAAAATHVAGTIAHVAPDAPDALTNATSTDRPRILSSWPSRNRPNVA